MDTNIVLIYTQSSPLAQQVEKDLELLQDGNMLSVSVVTIGEIESLMLQRGHGEKKKQAFRKMLGHLTIVDINIEELISRYAEIDAYSQGKHPKRSLSGSARNMGKNDLWIAATSSLYDLILITTGKDFEHLDGEFISLNYVDIKSYKE